MIVGENTCDGKKKSYEILTNLVPNLYIMDLPQMKSKEGKDLLKAEYIKFMKSIEDITGKTIDVTGLKKGINIVNNKRKAMHRLSILRKANPSPISGLDALLINQVYFYDDPVRFTDSVNKICDELELRISKGVGVLPNTAPRILVSGCPMAVPNWKLPWIIETSGAVIVGEESCVGERGTRNLTDDSGSSVDKLLDAIVERYFKVDCAIFTPNPERLNHIIEMAEINKADGVIHYGLQFCQPYITESMQVEKALEKKNIPTLRIDTDYSTEDIGQLKTRVEACTEEIK
jgi:benzoyl-CoA reductase/2-hydroxyglutaryl-CoA dehydratase subunit BcrC/BadD/HgdB